MTLTSVIKSMIFVHYLTQQTKTICCTFLFLSLKISNSAHVLNGLMQSKEPVRFVAQFASLTF
jgi:hypothetical protein